MCDQLDVDPEHIRQAVRDNSILTWRATCLEEDERKNCVQKMDFTPKAGGVKYEDGVVELEIPTMSQPYRKLKVS